MLYPLSYGGGSCTSRGRSYSHAAGAIPALMGRAKAAVSCISMPTDHDCRDRAAGAPPSAALGVGGRKGHLHVGGIDLLELVEQFGTPLFVYDEAHLRQACRDAVAAWGDGVAYATKAFLCRAMARLADEEGMHLDVASGGELHVALSAGVAPERLILHGNNKSADELARRCSRESAASSSTPSTKSPAWAPSGLLRRQDASGPRSSCGSRPASRRTRTSSCAPDRRTRSSASPSPPVPPPRPWPRWSSCPASSWPGVHAHIGSQVFEASSFEQAAEVLGAFFAPLGLPELVVGGGLGVPYVNGESAPTQAAWAEDAQRLRAGGRESRRRGSRPSPGAPSSPRRA